MKNILAVFILAATLVACQNNLSHPSSMQKTIMIESQGKVEVLPNEASFYINLSCTDKSIQNAKQCLVDKSNALINQLTSFGIKKEDILTTSVDLQKSYQWINNSNVFEGYRGSTVVHIKMRDINKLDEVYTTLLDNQNLELGGLSYTHSEMDSLKNEAYLNALKKSGMMADKLITELPEKNKEILRISNVQFSSSSPQPLMMANAEKRMENQNYDAGSIAISKGMIEVNATLFVEYAIK